MKRKSMKPEIYTIGHSTRSIEEFISILQEYEIRQLVDIRTIPKSRRNPQYGQENLKKSLAEAGIKYIQMKDLGGLRPAVKETKNAGWKNQSFRSEEHTSELQSRGHLVCRLLLEKQ